MANNWFEVDRAGLRELMDGKPKHWIVRELVANSFDEEIRECVVNVQWDAETRCSDIVVADDSPTGFKRLSDAFTLFASTEKRANPTQRGRFNMGEKQVLAWAMLAKIWTTTGMITFGGDGRKVSRNFRERGSEVQLLVKMTKAECEEVIEKARMFMPPPGVEYIVNGETVKHREPCKVVDVKSLPTEMIVDGQFRRTTRGTKLEIFRHDREASLLFEMGIPIQEITCPYDVNVLQKVPLSIDRDVVSESYLARIYGEVLNVMSNMVTPADSSEEWVREGMSQKDVMPEAVKAVIKARFGEKVVVAGPNEDPRSIDDAISNGYKIVYGSQLSAAEWKNVRAAGAIPAANSMFPHGGVAGGTPVEPTQPMKRVERLVWRIGKLCLGFAPMVQFYKWESTIVAEYGDRTLTFNVKRLGARWFDGDLAAIVDLIIHELGHEFGHHTEHRYHDAITRMGGQLVKKALEEQAFFLDLDSAGVLDDNRFK